LANLLFAKELARRFTGTARTANALHPGVIFDTNLQRSMTVPRVVRDAVAGLSNLLVLKSIPQGAATQCYVATNPALAAVSGQYFADCNMARPRADAEDASRLYRADPSQDAILANSPIRTAYDGIPFRSRLTSPAEKQEFPILTELRRAGVTDYVFLPVPFSDGTNKALSLATTQVDGFSDDEIRLFEAMMPAVAVNLEIHALRRMARTLLDTYVGRQSGGRVLAGQIRRGMGETINAVIWLSDLRGSTSLSESSPRDELIEMLNGYFGPMCDAVEASGGEVLKFIGDSVLAIFPIEQEAAAACHRALAAAHTAQAAIAAENVRRAGSGAPAIHYGLALPSAT
jgi:adenylate cyclase